MSKLLNPCVFLMGCIILIFNIIAIIMVLVTPNIGLSHCLNTKSDIDFGIAMWLLISGTFEIVIIGCRFVVYL